jgi:hypothetical protein
MQFDDEDQPEMADYQDAGPNSGDPTTPGGYEAYEATDDDLPLDIAGGAGVDDAPDPVLTGGLSPDPPRRKPGRPRKHPPKQPTKHAAIATTPARRLPPRPPGPEIQHFPKPPVFHFKDDNPGVGRQPGEFFRYCRRIAADPAYSDRIIMYVYRTWPVMKGDYRQIEKTISIQDYDDIMHRYGSGDYHFKFNDAGGARRTVAMCTAKGFRDESQPPILDMEGLDLMDPLNQTYIKNARSRGVKFPGDRESENEENDMASVHAVETLTGALQNTVDKVVDMAQRQSNQANQRDRAAEPSIDQSAVTKGLDIVAQAATMGNQMIQTAINQASAAQGRATDPMMILDKAVEIATAFGNHNGNGGSGSHGEVLEIMKMQQQQQQQFHDTLFKFQQDRINQLEHEMRERSNANNTTMATNQPKSLIEQMNEMKAAKDTMRDVLGLGEEGGNSGGSSWVEHLPLIIQGLGVLGSVIATGLHNLAIIKSGQGVPMQPPGPDAILTLEQQAEMRARGIPIGQGAPVPGTMPGAQSAGQPGGMSGNMGTPAGAAGVGGQVDMLTQYHQFLSMIELPLLRSFQDGESGAEFAEKLLLLGDNGLFGKQLNGQQVYSMVKENGQPAIMSLIRTYNPIWDVVRLTPQRWEQFMTDFFNAESIWEAEEREEREGATANAKAGASS